MNKKLVAGLVALGLVVSGWWFFGRTREAFVVSGYVMTSKNGESLAKQWVFVLDEKGNEVAQTETDSEGYFYTRLEKDKKYTLKSGSFEVDVIAQEKNKNHVSTKKGYFLQGKRLKDEVSEAVYQPGVIYIQDKEYGYYPSEHQVYLPKAMDLQKGDLLSLPPNSESLTGYVFKIERVETDDTTTIVNVSEDVSIEEVLQDVQLEGDFDLSDGYIIPATGTTLAEDTVELVSLSSVQDETVTSLVMESSEPVIESLKKKSSPKVYKNKEKSPLELHYESEGEGSIELKGNLSLKVSMHSLQDIDVESKISLESMISFQKEASLKSVNSKEEDERVKLATVVITTSTGYTIPIDIYFIFGASGQVEVVATDSEILTLGLNRKNNKWEQRHDFESTRNITVHMEGELETGFQEEYALGYKQLDFLTLYAKFPVLNMDGSADLELSQKNMDAPTLDKLEGKHSGSLGLAIGYDSDWVESREKKIPIYEWEYPEKKSSKKQTKKKEDSGKNNQKMYKVIFDNYQKMMDYVASGKTAEDIGFGNLMTSMQTIKSVYNDTSAIHSWVVESVIYSPERQRYAFYDIDKDGQDELFTASKNDDGSYFLTGLFYVKAGEPIIISEGFVAGHGGARSAMTVYTDGTILSYGWSSGTGEATGLLYKIEGQDVTQLETKDFKLPGDKPTQVFGKSYSDELDVKKLDWQEFDKGTAVSSPSHHEMDIEAIKNGDFTSLAGTWKNGSGDIVVIDNQGNIAYSSDPQVSYYANMNGSSIENGVLYAYITTPDRMASASVPTQFIPKGVVISKYLMPDVSDTTDHTKDRFFSTQGFMSKETLQQNVYYRTD